MTSATQNFPMPTWGYVALYTIFAIEMYVFFAPRSWKPWARRHDRAVAAHAARRAAAYAARPATKMSARDKADARTDRYIAACEGRITGNDSEFEVMAEEHRHMEEAGLLDPDQPTPWSHYQWRQKQTKEFTPEERMIIRYRLFPETT